MWFVEIQFLIFSVFDEPLSFKACLCKAPQLQSMPLQNMPTLFLLESFVGVDYNHSLILKSGPITLSKTRDESRNMCPETWCPNPWCILISHPYEKCGSFV